MKKYILLFYGAFLILNSSFAQSPLVKKWDKRYGGANVDFLLAMRATTDGGYILGGYSFSGIGGDKTQANWDATLTTSDFWVVKVDSLGNKQWDKDYGSTDWDQLWALTQSDDGGYLLGGYTSYLQNGDVSQATFGAQDFWVVKLDASGNKLWDKRYGGTGSEVLTALQQTTDKGYILGGRSASAAGGNKTSPHEGGYWDYWIVKIDSVGNKQWDKDYGGTGEEDLQAIQQTTDGGYIFGGYTTSGISGNKSGALKGIYDYWVVKTDASGNKQWDRDFGGTGDNELYSLIQSRDKGYILAGWSDSDSSGDKTHNNKDTSQTAFLRGDFWIIKLDSLGNKVWDNNYGGFGREDDIGSVTQTTDGGYLLAGTSYSQISGDKTEMNLGHEQTWIIKIDSLGNRQWDKTLFTRTGSGDDESGYALQSKDGCYLFANYTQADTGGYKTQMSQGSVDMWIIKFCDSTVASVSKPIASFQSSDTVFCATDCISFSDLSTNGPTIWQWSFQGGFPATSTDENPQSICYSDSGSFNVTLIATNAGGSDTLSLNNFITVHPVPATPVLTQSNDTLFCMADSSVISYQWYVDATLIPGATGAFIVVDSCANYNVAVKNKYSCSIAVGINDDPCVGINEYANDNAFSLYPNPARNELTVYGLPFTVMHIAIYNVLGQEASLLTPFLRRGESASINVSNLASGIYFVRVANEKESRVGKFVKE